MDHKSIYNTIKNEFCSVFDFKIHGATLEVITPIPTLTSKFISVFITQRGNDYIIADGGWLCDNIYDPPEMDEDKETLIHLNNQFIQYFGVAVREAETGRRIYYKSTERVELIAARVFEVANFIQAAINSQSVEFKEKKEKVEKDKFKTETSDYLKVIYKQNFVRRVELAPGIKFSAGIKHNDKLHVFDYVSGHNAKYFDTDISKAIVNFEILQRRPLILNKVASRTAILNDQSTGFPYRNPELLDLLALYTTNKPIIVSNIDMIKNLVPIGYN